VTVVLVVGAGEIGTRAVRQILDTPGFATVLLADRDLSRAQAAADALGPAVHAIDYTPGDAIPPDVAVIACALPAGVGHEVVAAAIAAGVPVASSDDEHDAIDQLRALDQNARASGVTVAIGCGLAPGLTDVLAVHAAALFDSVDEIRVARTGWAGPASVDTVRHERRVPVRAWRDGGWREERSRGDALVFFPDPIGGRDCRVVTGWTRLLVDAFPDVGRLSVQLGEPPRRNRFRRRFGDEGEWGAARVEVWGQRDGSHGCVAYGVVDRTAVAAGTVLAVVTARLAGVIGPVVKQPGVQGLGLIVETVPFLAELAQRGVRAAVFEGVPVA
jgi:Oxidoreductase family, NAD-binding Rossmann fold